MLRTRLAVLSVCASLTSLVAVACGGGGEATTSGGGTAAGGGTSGTPEERAPSTPPGTAGMRSHLDLIELAHLADVEHHGLYIDMGTAPRNKYTLGNWRTGWLTDGADGDETFTYAGRMGRLYVDLREASPLTVRLRMRAYGSRRLQVYVNGTTLPEGIELPPGEGWNETDVAIPASMVHAGENMIQLSFGGTIAVAGQDVSVAVSTVRIIPGTTVDDAGFMAPDWGTYVSEIEVGGVTRRSLAVRAPTTLSYYVEVPEGGRLVFGVGGEGEATAHAVVRVTPEGGTSTEAWSGDAGARWNDASVDLAAYAGQVVRLELVTEAAAGAAAGRVAWSVPAVMVPQPTATAEPGEIRNVVVLLIDTLRASKLRAYNPSSRVRTPVLDDLVAHGTLFERASSQENWTKPSVASVLTGLTPMTHGAKTDAARLPDSADMVSEAFDGANFATGSFIANGYVSDRFGFDQGWDHYTNMIRESRSTEAEDVFREAGDWIEQHSGERFFAYVQTIDPHVPYDPPAEYLAMYDDRPDYAGIVTPRRTHELLEGAKRNPPTVTFDASDVRRLEALHDGEITQHDHFFGLFIERLRALNVLDNTLVVITSDHGEEFDDHGSWGHGHSVYQELLGVPLIFWRPGTVPENRRIAHPVSTLNISQTVLDFANVEGLPHAEGRSLVGEIVRGELPAYPAVNFSDMLDDRRVIRASGWKMILNGSNTKLFNLTTDPGEDREITDMTRHPIAARYLRILLGQYLGATDRGHWWSATQSSGATLGTENATMDAETCAQLQALGYVVNCGTN
jgi:choline-sulfatase